MKLHYLKNLPASKLFAIAIFLVLFLFTSKMMAEEPKNAWASKEIIAVCESDNIYDFESVVGNYQTNHNQLGSKLLTLFKTAPLNFNQSAAAFFIGEIHYTNAVDDLASQITLRFQGVIMKHLVKISISKYPAMDALIKIGNPSIPSVIRNLAESSDTQVRELSFETLCRIDADKDIVQLRLQKALAAQQDLQKKARLQSALDELAKTSLK